MAEGRYSRQTALFGAEGQRKLESTAAAIIGQGGLGSHVSQQLSYLGLRRYGLVDHDVVDDTNLNRLVTATEADIDRLKVEIGARAISAIQPDADIVLYPMAFEAAPAAVITNADVVFSCVDEDLVRLAIAQRCAATGVPLFDLATDTGDDWFGGRVLFSGAGERCVSCMDLLDQAALRRATMNAGQRAEDARIYGVPADELEKTGPAVVSVNGVVASLAVTEYMKWRTEMSEPAALLTYRGDLGSVTRSIDTPRPDCFYCAAWPRTRTV
jgi:molybdopterin/thiamine biosynthesis adenylyltransferase